MTDDLSVMASRPAGSEPPPPVRVRIRDGDYIREVPLSVREQDPTTAATPCTATPTCKALVLAGDMPTHVQWHKDRAAEVQQLAAKVGITIKLL